MMYTPFKQKRSPRPSSSSHRKRHYDDQTSRHYDRIRIEKELDNFFDCRSNQEDEVIHPVLPSYHDNRPRRRSTSMYFNSDNNHLDHIMDPTFDPIDDRCDVDALFEFTSLDGSMSPDNTRDVNVLQSFDANVLQTLELNLDDASPKVPFVEKEVRQSQVQVSNNRKKQDYKIQEVVNHSSHIQQNPITNTATTEESNEFNVEPMNDFIQLENNPQHEQGQEQEQDQESIIDGFSVLHEELSPQHKMIITVDHQLSNQQQEEEQEEEQQQQQQQQSKSNNNNNNNTSHYYMQKQEDPHHDHPPELLMLSMDSSMTQSEETMLTCKSHLSYDDTPTITPSITFFLNANKQELNNEGLSIANGSHRPYGVPSSVSPNSSCRKLFLSNSSLGVSCDDVDNESHTAVGFSKGSSKYTSDSPRVLELRERKRMIERRHDIKYRKFPALIEVEVETNK